MKNKYEIRGDVTAIFLKRRDGTVLETLIDTSDLPRAQEIPCSWVAGWSRFTKSFYAMISAPKIDGKRKTIMLHRWLYGDLKKVDEVDHKNHDTLNNRRSINLRITNKQQNQQNRIESNKDNTYSDKAGLTWRADGNRWRVRVMINGRTATIGQYKDYHEAEKALISARQKYLPNSYESLTSEG